MVDNYRGPVFRRIREVEWTDLDRSVRRELRGGPLLVRGAVRDWPAWERWSFESLSQLQRADGSEVVTRFANGLDDQGVTRPPLDLPIGPYLRALAANSITNASCEHGLLTKARYEQHDSSATFYLDWSFMESFKPDRVYLSQWDLLSEFPALRSDLAIRRLWPGWWRRTWEYVFIGPERTVTGLHYDAPDNWFCQFAGSKEVILFEPDQRRFMCPSRKYDWGATLSDIDITRLSEQPRERERFARASGLYGRVEAGDALYIPRRTWHSLVALTPSISLGIFGLALRDILTLGVPITLLDALHRLRLFRWGNCTCHDMTGEVDPARL